MPRFLFLVLCLVMGPEARAETLTICYNYGCNSTAEVFLDRQQMGAVGALFSRAADPASEREAISRAVGMLEKYAGEQAPTHNDKGGNYDDDGVNGRMDCIDESANTAQYLMLLEARNWLKFHRVSDPVERAPLLLNEHWAASILDIDGGRYYAVDSWFFDNGQPAVVMDLEEWKSGGGPSGR